MRVFFVSLVTLLGALSAPALAANILEDFTKQAATQNGATLGSCKQLKVGLATSGSITIKGDGVAVFSTKAEADAAMLASANPLPSGGYSVSAVVSQVNYPKYGTGMTENGTTLLAISSAVPQPRSAQWWESYRMIAVEVDVMPDFTTNYNMFVNYWDGSNIYTWNGSAWAVGDDGWKPTITYSLSKSYTIEIKKSGGSYTIQIRSGSSTLVNATIAASKVRAASSEYMVIGERLTTHFKGSMNLHSVSMPKPTGCSSSKSDGGAAASDGGVGRDSVDPISSDVVLPTLDGGGGGPHAYNPGGAWDCQMGSGPATSCPLGLVLFLSLLVLRRLF